MPPQEAITMPDSEQEQVEELRKLLQLGSPELVGPNGKGRITLPPVIYKVLKDAVLSLQSGRSILLIPEEEEFTTQKAAKFLGVSRPHVIKLLEAGNIPFHKTGSHRRILVRDLTEYAKRRNAERKTVLAKMAKEAFEQGLYDKTAHMPEGGKDE